MKRLAAIFLGLVPLLASAQSPERLKNQVARMLKDDVDNPPSTEGVLFAGSDTVAGWDVRHYFGQYRTIRRAIPGATIADTTYYADQLIVPFKPSTIVLEIGDSEMTADFTKFVARIHTALPKTMIVVMSALDAAPASNEKLKAIAAQDKGIRYVDLEDLAGPDGKPDPALLADGKHQLNKLGYDLVSQTVRKEIQKAEARYWRGYDPATGQ
jgi:hypothetical protein